MTSTLASPRSASTSITSRPCAAMPSARLADTVVLPTPPLPPVTAVTFTGREALSFSRVAAWLRGRRVSRMGVPPPEGPREVGLLARRDALARLERAAHQPDAALMPGMQILRHALAVADMGDAQAMPQDHRERRSETRRLVDLGQDAG